MADLSRWLDDDDPDVRARAVARVGASKTARAAALLLRATYDSDPAVRDTAGRMLAERLAMPKLPALVEVAPALRTLRVTEGKLLALLKADDPQTRAAAAAAMGRVGTPWLMEALIPTAARDGDADVRQAAGMAVVGLGHGLENDIPVYLVNHLAEIRIPKVDFEDVEVKDAISFLPDVARVSCEVRWNALTQAGVDRDRKITLKLKNVSMAVTMCALCDAMSVEKPVGFVCAPVPRFSTVDDLARWLGMAEWAHVREGYSQAGRRNAAAWRKMQRTMHTQETSEFAFSELVQFLRDITGLRIVVNEKALRSVGEGEERRVDAYMGRGKGGLRTPWAVLRAVAAQASDGAAVCLIDGGVVYVDSEAALRRRMLTMPPRGRTGAETKSNH